jgi:hypothetical protein
MFNYRFRFFYVKMDATFKYVLITYELQLVLTHRYPGMIIFSMFFMVLSARSACSRKILLPSR